MQLRVYSDPVIRNPWHIKEPHKTNRCNLGKRISSTHDAKNGRVLQVRNDRACFNNNMTVNAVTRPFLDIRSSITRLCLT